MSQKNCVHISHWTCGQGMEGPQTTVTCSSGKKSLKLNLSGHLCSWTLFLTSFFFFFSHQEPCRAQRVAINRHEPHVCADIQYFPPWNSFQQGPPCLPDSPRGARDMDLGINHKRQKKKSLHSRVIPSRVTMSDSHWGRGVGARCSGKS